MSAAEEKFKLASDTRTEYLIEAENCATVSDRLSILLRCIATLPDTPSHEHRKLVKVADKSGKSVFIAMSDDALEQLIGKEMVAVLSQKEVVGEMVGRKRMVGQLLQERRGEQRGRRRDTHD